MNLFHLFEIHKYLSFLQLQLFLAQLIQLVDLDNLEEVEKRAILQALEKTNQNKTAAAKLLGVSFRTLRYRLVKLGLSKEAETALEDELEAEE